MTRAPVTNAIAELVSATGARGLPPEVMGYTRTLIVDGVATLAAATHPLVTSSAGIGAFAARHGGAGVATLFGQRCKVDVVSAALANGTRGYAVDMEPHHPEAILHPVAVVLPTALALAEAEGRPGRDVLTAVAVGCEITYRVSMSMRPKELYALGFHPSAVCGAFTSGLSSASRSPRSTARISSRIAISASHSRSSSARDSLSVGSIISVPATGKLIVGAWKP